MKHTILEIVALHAVVLSKRQKLINLFKGLDVSVTIGGSYALRAQCRAFAGRKFHDIDYIVSGPDAAKAKSLLDSMLALNCIRRGDSCSSGGYNFGHIIHGYKMEVLINENPTHLIPPCFQFESLEDICKAKEGYIRKYQKLGKEPRKKDVEDVAKIKEYLSKDEIPF